MSIRLISKIFLKNMKKYVDNIDFEYTINLKKLEWIKDYLNSFHIKPDINAINNFLSRYYIYTHILSVSDSDIN